LRHDLVQEIVYFLLVVAGLEPGRVELGVRDAVDHGSVIRRIQHLSPVREYLFSVSNPRLAGRRG
jgi:hypothetical protein